MSEYERVRRQCLKRAELYEDPEFSATQSSVFYHQSPPYQFVWKRPKVFTLPFFNLCLRSKHSFLRVKVLVSIHVQIIAVSAALF